MSVGRFIARHKPDFGKYSFVRPSVHTLRGSIPPAARRTVPSHIASPPWASNSEWTPPVLTQIERVNDSAIAAIRRAGMLAKRVVHFGGALAKAGTTTDDIDRQLHDMIVAHGAYPSSLNYKGFPKSVCTSINNVLAHGIPDELQSGDIINIDVTVYLSGFHGDCSMTFAVGDVDQQGLALVEHTREALQRGLAVCGDGVRFSEIGRAIQDYASEHNLSVVPNFCGHGIGRLFHMPPDIFHIPTDSKATMAQGMVFTVEPILCQGSPRHALWPDGWTAVTRDGGRSAQFEETIAITADGHQVLTPDA
ncbi:hypothetical protein RI367_006968 [Sorochytrium milnesiophthora]